MFLNSSTRLIDPVLNDIVAEIEQSPALSVLAARQFSHALLQTPIKITSTKYRQFNAIEEFIFRAAVDLESPITETELADILGLAPVFINRTVEKLQKIKALEVVTDSTISLTSSGHTFYTDQKLPEDEVNEVYGLFNPLSNYLMLNNKRLKKSSQQSTNNNKSILKVKLAELIKIEDVNYKYKSFLLPELQKLLQEADDITHHAPEDGKIVKDFSVSNKPEEILTSLSIFAIFNIVEGKIIIEARRGKEELKQESESLNIRIDNQKVSAYLNSRLEEEGTLLNTLFKLKDKDIEEYCEDISKRKNEEVEKRVDTIRAEVHRIAILKSESIQEQNRSLIEVNSGEGTIALLRNGTISDEFDNLLDSAIHQVIIYSPWVNKTIINDLFIKRLKILAKKGIWILIGHGIAQNKSGEDRLISKELENKLRSIKSPEGIPIVQIFWLGESHTKEVITDQKVFILGSNNLLSCRASSGLWAESACKITIPQIVHDAYEYNAGRFRSKAQELWAEAIENLDIELAKQAIYLWGALEMEEEIFSQISKYVGLHTTWIKVIMQGLLSKRIPHDAKCCQDVENWFRLIDTQDSEINSLRSRWNLAMGK